MTHWLTLLLAIVALSSCEKKRTPARYLIPADYDGVVITVFNQQGFPELPLVDGFRVHKYPADGILITSSGQEFGWASDETLDVLTDGTHRRLPTRHSGGRCERFSATGSQSRGGVTELEYYFKAVGSDEYWKDRDGAEYDKKVAEAISKLTHSRQKKSEQSASCNPLPAAEFR